MLSGGHLALLIQCMVIKWNGGPHRAACLPALKTVRWTPCPPCLYVLNTDPLSPLSLCPQHRPSAPPVSMSPTLTPCPPCLFLHQRPPPAPSLLLMGLSGLYTSGRTVTTSMPSPASLQQRDHAMKFKHL